MNIILNGGTRGIGRETALYLACDPQNSILVTGRNTSALKELEDRHCNIRSLAIDFSDPGQIAGKFLKVVAEGFNSIDILINMAGLMIPREFMEITESEARMMVETNFMGPATAIRILKPFMKEGSHIVNISSMGGFQGSSKYKGLAWYSASKAAIACLTECLAEEFRESGIRVNCLALGSVQTEMLNEAFPGYTAPVSPAQMGEFVGDFALKGHKVFNGKILPVAVTNP
jgi:NAD(P)-dependent dehydrogenase (short-subunit alcohol dehydrogenase family)